MPRITDPSSLRPAFMTSAPGKVIVYGEHAVVYGKPAIAAAISLRSYLLVTFLPKSNRIVSLCSPDIGLDHSWNIDDLPWDVPVVRKRKDHDREFITTLDLDLVEALQPHIKSVSPNRPEHERKIHQASAFAFLYLLLLLSSQDSDPCIYTVRTTIPVGAGLGSSASLSVCIASALLIQKGALARPCSDQPPRETESQINQVNKWAFVAEMCIHGNPSGVDNTVSSGGKAVVFQKKKSKNKDDAARCPPTVVPLHRFPELPLLLVNTRAARSATDEIAKVKSLRDRHPRVVDGVLDAIGATADSAHELITARDFDERASSSLSLLGDLMAVNHGLLAALGVSHPKLERARELVERLGVGWTKLTGAGGGGCAIVLPRPAEAESHPGKQCAPVTGESEMPESPRPFAQRLGDLRRMLAEEGMEMFTTTLAGDGVGVLWPAVLHDTSSGEDGGADTDQERFLKAEGKEAIESLVGMNVALHDGETMAGCRDGWGFWRR